MSDDVGTRTAEGTAEQLHALGAEACALVAQLPGPLRRIVVRSGDHAIKVEWPGPQTAMPEPADGPARNSAVPPVAFAQPAASAGEATPGPPATEDAAVEGHHILRAPLVGTFYAAAQPGAEPFVSVGDLVRPGQAVAIVEAMKLMNHIAVEGAGRVVEVLVADGDAVEFEQPLMRIAPIEGEDDA